jgi:hypothetical protein
VATTLAVLVVTITVHVKTTVAVIETATSAVRAVQYACIIRCMHRTLSNECPVAVEHTVPSSLFLLFTLSLSLLMPLSLSTLVLTPTPLSTCHYTVVVALMHTIAVFVDPGKAETPFMSFETTATSVSLLHCAPVIHPCC